MSTDSSISDPGSDVIVQFLTELEGHGGDEDEILRRYCACYPHRAGEFHDLIESRRVLERSAAHEGGDAGCPERLGDFAIVRKIADGGMGVIYEAVQEPFHRRVAVKTIRRNGRPVSPTLQARFVREQKVLAQLHHTHIVPIHAAGQDGLLQYYAMQFVAGASLDRLIRSARNHMTTGHAAVSSLSSLAELAVQVTMTAAPPQLESGSEGLTLRTSAPRADSPRPPRAAVTPRLSNAYLASVAKVMADTADALSHAHRAGIIHRDLKPSNILLDRDEHCWVVDFGLASLHAGANGVATVPIAADPLPPQSVLTVGNLGTPPYMAPEQFDGRADARTDVWGLGVTLYELLTLRRAFDDVTRIKTTEPPRPRTLVANLPRDLEAICLKSMAKEPAHRYQNAAELRDDLRRWLRHEPIQARPARPIRRLALWARRNPGWASAIGLALIGLTLVVAVAVAGERAERREVHLQQMQRIRLTSHSAGWFDDVWELARRAPRIGRDANLQSQAAAALAGLDARKVKSFPLATTCQALAFDRAPGRDRMLMSESDGRVRTWNPRTDQAHTSEPTGAGPFAFRPDGTAVQLVRAPDRHSVEPRDVAASKALRTFAFPVAGRSVIEAWALAPEGSHVAASIRTLDDRGRAGEEGIVAVWEAGAGRLLRSFPVRRPTDVALSDGGALLAAGSEDGRIFVWDMVGGEPLGLGPLTAGHSAIHGLAFAPDPHRGLGLRPRLIPGGGFLLASGDAGGGVIVWDLSQRIPRSYCRGSVEDVYAVAFSPDGTTLASCGRYAVKLWDLATGRHLLDLKGGNYLVALAFAPDGKRLAVGRATAFSHPGGVDVWEIEEGRGIQTLRGLSGANKKLAFSRDGQRLAALSQGWQVAIWDRASGRLIRLLDVPPGPFTDHTGLAFSPDGRRFAFAAGHEAWLWDVDTGAERGSWSLPEGLGNQLAFRGPDRLLIGRVETKDGRGAPLRGYDPREYPRVYAIRDLLGPEPTRPLAVLADFNLYVCAADMSPDGTYGVIEGLSGSPGNEVRSIQLFEVATGKSIWTIPSHQPADDLGASVGFDPTGKFVALALVRSAPPTLFEIPSRKVVGTSDVAPSSWLAPGATKWLTSLPVTRADPVGWTLIERGRLEPSITFLTDHPGASGAPRFNSDGLHVAWGQMDGTVLVVDLAKVQRRLAGIGLGW